MTMVPFDSTKPATNDLRASSPVRNNLGALFNGDFYALRPRAQASPNMTVHVNSTLAEGFWIQTWQGLLAPLTYAGGNSPTLTAPTSNPRIDLLTIDSAGTLAWVVGAEAASPATPNCPDAKIPICYVYCKTTMTKIVNFEDTGANPNEGYIYRDVRPFLNLGGVSVTPATNFMSFSKAIFGDGSDGDATISVNTTLSVGSGGVKVMQYNNLTVNSGIYLQGAVADQVLVILVKGTLTLNGTIKMHGGAGGATPAAVGAGNPGGAGGPGGGGGGGGDATYAGGGGGGGGFPGSGLTAGGVGAFRDGGKGGNGGAVGAYGLPGVSFLGSLKAPVIFEIFRYLYGGGGGSGAREHINADPIYGGDGGGALWIEANSIVWGGSGLVSCNGIDGHVRTYNVNGDGGGGGGGIAQVVFKYKSGSSTITASKGIGGHYAGYRYGGDGSDGLTGEFQVQ